MVVVRKSYTGITYNRSLIYLIRNTLRSRTLCLIFLFNVFHHEVFDTYIINNNVQSNTTFISRDILVVWI